MVESLEVLHFVKDGLGGLFNLRYKADNKIKHNLKFEFFYVFYNLIC